MPAGPPRSEASRKGAEGLRIAGLRRLSTVDWPDRLAAVVFLQGCPWRCWYCQNPALLDAHGHTQTALSWEEVWAFARRRRGLLDGIVLSGGEPTLQPGVVDAAQRFRSLGFSVGAHSCGVFPRVLRALLPELDWIGLDVKALPEDYPVVTGRPGSGVRAWESLDLVLAEQRRREGGERPLEVEVRTTVDTRAFGTQQVSELMQALADAGVRRYAIQDVRPVDPDADTTPTLGRRMRLSRPVSERLRAPERMDVPVPPLPDAGLPMGRFEHFTHR